MEHYHHDGCTSGCDHDHEECTESKIEQAFSKYNLNLDDEKIKAQVERILNECKEENNTIEVKKFLLNSVELTTLQTTDSSDSVPLLPVSSPPAPLLCGHPAVSSAGPTKAPLQ